MVQELEEGGVVGRINLVGGAESIRALPRLNQPLAFKLTLHPRRQRPALSVCGGNDECFGVSGLGIPMTFDFVPVIGARLVGGDFGFSERSQDAGAQDRDDGFEVSVHDLGGAGLLLLRLLR